MPSPKKGEKEQEFISRCMGSAEANDTFPRQDQRAAFCYSQWKRSKKKKMSNGEEVSEGTMEKGLWDK